MLDRSDFCSLVCVSFVSVSAIITLPASAQVINEDFKLLGDDTSRYDLFSESIAVGDGVVAVGAHDDGNENGVHAGAVYLFDAATGVQLFKLIGSDSGDHHRFGHSVAIADGVVAVGAPGAQGIALGSGLVYLFDLTTGAQIGKLASSDGELGDYLGWSVSIDDGFLVAGAVSDDDNGINSGSAYMFDVSTGEQVAKLVPNDGEAGDAFGWSVAISNGVVVVGGILQLKNIFGSLSDFFLESLSRDLISFGLYLLPFLLYLFILLLNLFF